MAKDGDVPQPGPARLSKGAGPDEWLEQAKQCKYLPEADMKQLCEIVKECLMEGALQFPTRSLAFSGRKKIHHGPPQIADLGVRPAS
jgi:serine/threonine-protein phosphatase PP1-1